MDAATIVISSTVVAQLVLRRDRRGRLENRLARFIPVTYLYYARNTYRTIVYTEEYVLSSWPPVPPCSVALFDGLVESESEGV